MVAANGGGIQAAAWTAKGITGLQKEVGDQFGKSIRLISTVSGCSLGAMYFPNEYTEGGPPSANALNSIVERAERSSLDKIGWGATYPDFLRLIVPYKFKLDRARVLEEAWQKEISGSAKLSQNEPSQSTLLDWQNDFKRQIRPGLIFNTTIADSGERLPLSTIDLAPESRGEKNRRDFFNGLCARSLGVKGLQPPCSKDISVLTATRLSAAFPYIAPAAHADVDGPGVHIVDGGYYDKLRYFLFSRMARL